MRRAFLMLFGGGLSGQITTTPQSVFTCGSSDPKVCDEIARRAKRKPANGECPVCGEMAPPLKPRIIAYRTRLDSDGAHYMEPIYDGPSPRTVRCAHCSNAFYQDAEAPR